MGDLRGMEGNQLEYLPREGDPYSDEGSPYGGSEVKGYRSDSRAYKGYRRGGYEGDMKGYESDSRGYGDQQTMSQSWHEPADRLPVRHGSQYWAGGESNDAPRRRQRANTGTYSSPQHAAAGQSTGGSSLLAIEDSSTSSSTPGVKRRSGGGGLRPRQANSMYGTLPRSGRPARAARQLPETPAAPVRRTWHGKESTREELGRTVSASPVRKREGAKVARPVRRPAKKEVATAAVKKEEVDDFSMTYSAEAEEVENSDERRKCDIS